MNKTLGGRIRELRDELDLSLRELAKKLGDVSAAHLSDIELGRRYPSDELLAKMAKTLRVRVADLRSYDNRPPVEALKKLSLSDPAFGLALRKLVDKEITSEDILRLAHNKRDREKP